MLALLTTSIPLTMTLTAALIAADANGELASDPPPRLLNNATSVHVFAFSSLGDLLVVESEGPFSIGIWEKAHIKAEQVCRGHGVEEDGDDKDTLGDMDMESKGALIKEEMLNSILQEQVTENQRWKQSGE